jgi:hypothetical protein
MIPTLIRTAILLPGLSMPDKPASAETIFDPTAIITRLPEDPHDGVEWLEAEAKVIYSVDRDKVIKIKDVKVENGRLAERLFCLCGVHEVSAIGGLTSRHWFGEFLGDGGYDLVEENNMAALYEVANDHFQGEIENAKSTDPFPEEGSRTLTDADVIREQRLFDQSFLGLWEVSTSQGYYDIAPEIDDISFEGEGRVELMEEKKGNPTF